MSTLKTFDLAKGLVLEDEYEYLIPIPDLQIATRVRISVDCVIQNWGGSSQDALVYQLRELAYTEDGTDLIGYQQGAYDAGVWTILEQHEAQTPNPRHLWSTTFEVGHPDVSLRILSYGMRTFNAVVSLLR